MSRCKCCNAPLRDDLDTCIHCAPHVAELDELRTEFRRINVRDPELMAKVRGYANAEHGLVVDMEDGTGRTGLYVETGFLRRLLARNEELETISAELTRIQKYMDGDLVAPAPRGLTHRIAEAIEGRDSVIMELNVEIDRLKDCAREQEKGISAKTMRVEIIPKPKNRLAVCVTFPSGMEDGERKASETAVHTLVLAYETAKALADAEALTPPKE